jgi:uncharacterized MAPEG superfamily protein
MTIAFWCVLVAGLLPYVVTVLYKTRGDFDNQHPRQWATTLSGWRARAHAAQQNSFEAFPFFAAAVLIAHALHAPQATVDTWSLIFVGARIAYQAAYLANWATLRSIIWVTGMICIVTIFLAGT